MSGKFREKVSGVLAIPQEIVMDVPRIVFDSNTKAFVENYKGISEYSGEVIRINAGRSIISFYGENMEIRSMTTEDLIIEGIIKTMEFS